MSTPAQKTGNPDNNPLYGIWEMVPAESVYYDAEMPQSHTLVFEPNEEGIETAMIVVDQQDNVVRLSWLSRTDNTSSEVRGSTQFSRTTFQQTGPRTYEAEYTHAGRVVAEVERQISFSGTEMTIEVITDGNLSSRTTFNKVQDY